MNSSPTTDDLVAQIRTLAASLHRTQPDDAALEAAMDHLTKAGELIGSGAPRLRWYEQLEADSITTRNRDLSPFSGRLNAIAPPMTFETGESDAGGPALLGRVRIDRLREGPPHTVHGGVVAGLFDEILGAGQRLTGRLGGVTGRLTVRYRKPTPLDQDLTFRSWVHEDRSRRLVMRGDCKAAGVLTAEAQAVFIRVDFEAMERSMRET